MTYTFIKAQGGKEVIRNLWDDKMDLLLRNSEKLTERGKYSYNL